MSNKPYRICLVEDDEIMGEALADRFVIEGFECEWFKTGRPAMQALGRRAFDVVICDLRLPDIHGEDLFVQLGAGGAHLPPFVFMTAYGTIDRAVRLLKLGAHDYLTKPVDVHALLDTVRRLCLEARPVEVAAPTLGISKAMIAIEEMLPRIAKTGGSVLITGESGVGKERVARALHDLANEDGARPFVAVNCGALTESLMEAELFGHVKGAFTGAVRDKKGYFEQASGGTLFLDEIAETSPTMQVKLLRAIQEREIVRVGGEDPVAVDIRLMCATHQDLRQLVDAGRFREDLYYRIHVIHIHVPPLRERKDDIVWLARNLLDAWAADTNDRRSLHRMAEQALIDYPWPGNIRELKHCLERACILSRSKVLPADAILTEHALNAPSVDPGSLSEYLELCERKFIENSLSAHGGRIVDTANALGISRKNLWEKMRKLQIRTASPN